eukprot:comp20777_c0_seq1/m.27280 comp20777_c0_seq1/g.27280  ORF comp20777_c0_seq1/g.27280 comp20777_c0_seq1/m.27280 type:complete len:343 (-) comp20777_c0_seq1:1000-2028(-)
MPSTRSTPQRTRRTQEREHEHEQSNGFHGLGTMALVLAAFAGLALASYKATKKITELAAKARVDEALEAYTRNGGLHVDELVLAACDARICELRLKSRPLKVDVEEFRRQARDYGVEQVVVDYINELAGDETFVENARAEHWWCELKLQDGLGYLVCVKDMYKDGATMRVLYAPDEWTADWMGFGEMEKTGHPTEVHAIHEQVVQEVPSGLWGPLVSEVVGHLGGLDPHYHVLRSNCQHLARAVHTWFADHLAIVCVENQGGKAVSDSPLLTAEEISALKSRLESGWMEAEAANRAQDFYQGVEHHWPGPDDDIQSTAAEEDFLIQLAERLRLEAQMGPSQE